MYQFFLLWLLNFISYLEKYSPFGDYNNNYLVFSVVLQGFILHITSLDYLEFILDKTGVPLNFVQESYQAFWHLLNPSSHHRRTVTFKSSSMAERHCHLLCTLAVTTENTESIGTN